VTERAPRERDVPTPYDVGVRQSIDSEDPRVVQADSHDPQPTGKRNEKEVTDGQAGQDTMRCRVPSDRREPTVLPAGPGGRPVDLAAVDTS
jgi:hypothetical protein